MEAKPNLIPQLTVDVTLQQGLGLQFQDRSRYRSGEWVQRRLVVQTDLGRDLPVHELLQLSLHQTSSGGL